jgi:hypothetical protein
MPNKKEISRTLKFTITSNGGDGAYLCYQKVSQEIYDFFQKNNLDLEEYALDDDYAIEQKIPEKLQPFNPGERASFGYYECGMTATDYLQLYIENEQSKEVFSGKIPKSNIKRDKDLSESLMNKEKGIYVVGYEGLEDCGITGTLEVQGNFDIKKFQIKYSHLDYELGDRELISSVCYEGEELDWEIDSYEGTGDNTFGFLIVE